jgi:hypothetical protein
VPGAQSEGMGGDDGADEGDQGPRHAMIDPPGDEDHGEDGEGDAERPAVDGADLIGHLAPPPDGGRPPARYAEDDGELADDDLHGDARQHAGDDGGGEELGDPAEAQQADDHQEGADEQGDDRHHGPVPGRPDEGDRGHAGGEHRGDGRVRPHREMTVGTEQGVEEGTGHEGVEAGDGRQAGEARRGHLGRQRHRHEGQTGQGVGAEPGRPVASQRRRDPPGSHAATTHRPATHDPS